MNDEPIHGHTDMEYWFRGGLTAYVWFQLEVMKNTDAEWKSSREFEIHA